jgi:probable F420-dependent oxidoreductase
MPHKRPFRFGVAAGDAPSREEWVAKARRIEELGYSTFLVPDHFVNDISPFPALSIAAEATTTLRVGTYVCDNDFRHPALLAKDSATLDLLSGGRFELGIGAGWHGGDYEQTGIPFDPPGVRVGRMEEAVKIVKALFGQEPVTFEGKYYKITGLNGLPKPAQRPHPPIFIAGGGKRVLSIAAREADIVGVHTRTYADGSGGDPSSTSGDATEEKLQWIRDAAGDRFDRLELNILVGRVVFTEDRKQAAEEIVAGITAPGYTAELLLGSPAALFGTVDEIVTEIQARRERWGFSYVTVLDDVIEAFAPVVERLNGK